MLVQTSRPVQAAPGSSAFNASCTASEQVGDAVYVLSAGQVRKALADVLATARVAGVITVKPTATTCTCISGGPVAMSGLTPGAPHFLSAATAGAASAAEPGPGKFRVPLGMAKTTTEMVLEIGEPEQL